jgi:hypothetical protein
VPMPSCFLATLYAPSPSVRGLGEDTSQALVRLRRLNVDPHVRALEQVSAAEIATKAWQAGPKNNTETGPFVEDARQFGGSETGPPKSTVQMQISGRSVCRAARRSARRTAWTRPGCGGR